MRRILEVDALRGVCSLAIIAAHVGLIPGSPWVLSAVDMFFVLSGYFITVNILRNRHAPRFLPVFFVRRSLRIWPAYYLALAACLVLNRSLKWDAPPDAWPYYLTFTQNVQAYLGLPLPRFSGMFIHTWTLAIEEQFYILWPLLLFRAGPRMRLGIVSTFAVLPTLVRLQGTMIPYVLLTRCDGLALGSLLALILEDRDRLARHLPAHRLGFGAIALAALLVPAFLATPLSANLFITQTALLYFGAAGLVLCFQGHVALTPLRNRALAYIGTVSYGLYLYHPLVFATLPALYNRYVIRKLGVSSVILRDILLMGFALVLAELSRRYLEGPILALKDRLVFAGASPLRGPHARPTRVESPVVSSEDGK